MQTARKVVITFPQEKRHIDVVRVIEKHPDEVDMWGLSFHGDTDRPHFHLALSLNKAMSLSAIARWFRVPISFVQEIHCSFEAMEAYVTQDGKYPVLKG